jgi:stage II sporulation protein D
MSIFVLTVAFRASLVCALLALRAGETREETLPVRNVRVSVAAAVQRVRLRAEGGLTVIIDGAVSGDFPTSDGWVVALPQAPSRIKLGRAVLPGPSVIVRGQEADVITMSVYRNGEWESRRSYAGTLRVTVDDGARLGVINNVDVERYVASVVANEVWPTFEMEAYRGQAIAARTFVLYQMQRRNSAEFDISATQGSQVYRGLRTDVPGRRAVEAARHTRGIVLTFADDGGDEKLFSTYYSAACGGISQPATIFGPGDDIGPLSGGVRCDYCRIAPGRSYRWGPVRLTTKEVRARLVSAYPALVSLGRIETVEVIERTSSGRPVRLRIKGATGKSHDILAERFRLAIDGNAIRSTDFKLHSVRGQVRFEDGRGFGHGLGLCQWGMQGQALQGKRAGEILRYYYPGSKLTRVY